MKALPYPADSHRQFALAELDSTRTTVSKLLVYFRGHEKDTSQLESVMLQLHTARLTLENLDWPSTVISRNWEKTPSNSAHGHGKGDAVTLDGETLPPGAE